MKFLILLSVLGLTASVFGTTPPPIIYKRVSSFVWVWDDRGTGATRGITVWRPQAVQSGFYALGDVGIPHTNSPTPESSAILVKAIESDALHPPVAFSEVWRDVDSGGQYNGRILKMLPKSGYTCLGFVAVQSWTSDPDLDLFRCVKNEFVTAGAGTYSFLWNDVGSESAGAVSLFQNLPSGSDTFALDANTFSAIPEHSDIAGSPALLNGRFVKNHQDINLGLPEAAVNVYETTDMSLIWNDKGTGAILGISVWRSKGKSTTYSLGDIAYPRTGGDPNRGFVVKAVNKDALGAPVDFREIYRTSGTGGDWDGSFHQPVCSVGYRAIGHVAVRGFSKPAADSVRCIKDEYTTPGEWKFIWNDETSGGHQRCTVYEAIAQDNNGQSVQAMSAVQSHSDMTTGAYVLKTSAVNYLSGKAATKYTIQNVVYGFDDRKIMDNDPESITRTTLVNQGNTEQSASRTLSYEYAEEYSWGNSAGLEIGVETSISTGIPFIVSGEVTVSTAASYTHEWGGLTSETHTDAIAVTVTVQPLSSKVAEVVGNRYTIDLPYTATLITHYVDGTTGKREDFTGTFRGVEVNDIRVIYQPDILLV